MTLNTGLTDPEVIGNYIEAVFWMAVGITVGIVGWMRKPAYKRLSLVTCGLFVVFGVSDVVEAQTGAWWRPVWLLAWKGLCLLALAACYWRHRRIRARSQ